MVGRSHHQASAATQPTAPTIRAIADAPKIANTNGTRNMIRCPALGRRLGREVISIDRGPRWTLRSGRSGAIVMAGMHDSARGQVRSRRRCAWNLIRPDARILSEPLEIHHRPCSVKACENQSQQLARTANADSQEDTAVRSSRGRLRTKLMACQVPIVGLLLL